MTVFDWDNNLIDVFLMTFCSHDPAPSCSMQAYLVPTYTVRTVISHQTDTFLSRAERKKKAPVISVAHKHAAAGAAFLTYFAVYNTNSSLPTLSSSVSIITEPAAYTNAPLVLLSD